MAAALPAVVSDLDPRLQQNFDALLRIASPTLVTAIPTVDLYDGMECYYLADSTNGVVWHFKYRQGSASAYKWEFVGGPAITVYGSGSGSGQQGTSYATLGTAATSLTVPLAGDYILEHGADLAADSGTAYQSLLVGATAAADADAVLNGGATPSFYGSVARVLTKAGLAASTTLATRYRGSGALINIYVTRPWLAATPVRVG